MYVMYYVLSCMSVKTLKLITDYVISLFVHYDKTLNKVISCTYLLFPILQECEVLDKIYHFK